jgi:septum formation protein
MKRLILASESPRRRELLGGLGLAFETVVSGIDETPLDGESPVEHAMRLAREKALAVSRNRPGALVIGADTVVIINGEVLGKPEDASHARQMLTKLSGRKHRVITGFALVEDSIVLVNESVSSHVLFMEIPPDELEWYLRTKEPYDKAGAYAVQGIGALFIREIEGSFTNVIGLPLAELVEALKRIGAFRFEDLTVEKKEED